MATAYTPFTIRVLGNSAFPDAQSQTRHFLSLLPATSRTQDDHIIAPQLNAEFLEQELLVKRLNAVHDWLWLSGRPMPARPLHHQALVCRDITVTENIELHLIWSKNRIFIKPIPRYILDPDFWSSHLLSCQSPLSKQSDLQLQQQQQQFSSCALGFLFSYTALIAHESDFRIAQEKGLLPSAVTWETWKELCAQFLQNHCYACINPRYWYGELRLSRLNKIYRFKMGALLREYSKVAAHAFYFDILRDNFAALAALLAYVVIVLTAMQVGPETDELQQNKTFQGASYGFTVFSIAVPLIAAVAIVLGITVLFASNWFATKAYHRKRFLEMGFGIRKGVGFQG
jgi:hypothetical protein